MLAPHHLYSSRPRLHFSCRLTPTLALLKAIWGLVSHLSTGIAPHHRLRATTAPTTATPSSIAAALGFLVFEIMTQKTIYFTLLSTSLSSNRLLLAPTSLKTMSFPVLLLFQSFKTFTMPSTLNQPVCRHISSSRWKKCQNPTIYKVKFKISVWLPRKISIDSPKV